MEAPLWALVTALILFAAWNLWLPYSLWIDEIFSVQLSREEWGPFWAKMFSDVHPPLYQIILKFWMGVFGSDEVSARSLSFVFAASIFGLCAYLARRRSTAFAVVFLLLLGASGQIIYYAQEARSYAMLALLATSIFFFYKDSHEGRSQSFKIFGYLLLFAASMTHYFGVLLSGAILLRELWSANSKGRVLEVVVCGVFLLIYPVVHMTFGVTERLGGNFWITSDGPTDTLANYLAAQFPIPLFGLDRVIGLGSTISIALVGTVLLIGFCSGYVLVKGRDRSELLYAGYIIFFCVMAAVVIDLHTPISTSRNFIILTVPTAYVAALVISGLVEKLPPRPAAITLGLMVAALAVQYYGAFDRMDRRWDGNQDWKGLADVVRQNQLCRDGCIYAAGPRLWQWRYYFDANVESGGDLHLTYEEILRYRDGERRQPILVAHVNPERLKELNGQLIDLGCYIPYSAQNNSVAVFDYVQPEGSIPCF